MTEHIKVPIADVVKEKEELLEHYYECGTCFYEPTLLNILWFMLFYRQPVDLFRCPKCGCFTVLKAKRKIRNRLTQEEIFGDEPTGFGGRYSRTRTCKRKELVC
jgi:hypothetical protein